MVDQLGILLQVRHQILFLAKKRGDSVVRVEVVRRPAHLVNDGLELAEEFGDVEGLAWADALLARDAALAKNALRLR